MATQATSFCELHPDANASYWDFGDGESGPQVPVLVCPECTKAEQPTCPMCGGVADETSHWTRNYGGGWDTFVKCLNTACGWSEVST